jgi:hypothetical protein
MNGLPSPTSDLLDIYREQLSNLASKESQFTIETQGPCRKRSGGNSAKSRGYFGLGPEILNYHHNQLLRHFEGLAADFYTHHPDISPRPLTPAQKHISITLPDLAKDARWSAYAEVRKDYPNGCGKLTAVGCVLLNWDPVTLWVDKDGPKHYFPFLGQK